MTRADDYRALRAKHPGAGALNAWRWATAPKPHRLEWEDEGSETVGAATIAGWDVRATITDDIHVDASETYGTLTDTYERGAFENPYWREYHQDDSPSDRRWHDEVHGRRHHDGTGAARWYIDGSGETFDELRRYYRKSGMSRHEAYTRALADYRERAEIAREAYADRYGNGRYAFAYVSVTVSLAGVEIAEASYGGASWERDYSKPLGPQLDAIVDDAVREALAEAPTAVYDAMNRELETADAIKARGRALMGAYATMVGGAA
jgi:hypothetical protein